MYVHLYQSCNSFSKIALLFSEKHLQLLKNHGNVVPYPSHPLHGPILFLILPQPCSRSSSPALQGLDFRLAVAKRPCPNLFPRNSVQLFFPREAIYAKNHFQQNRYSVFESYVMRKESISTKILPLHGNGEVV